MTSLSLSLTLLRGRIHLVSTLCIKVLLAFFSHPCIYCPLNITLLLRLCVCDRRSSGHMISSSLTFSRTVCFFHSFAETEMSGKTLRIKRRRGEKSQKTRIQANQRGCYNTGLRSHRRRKSDCAVNPLCHSSASWTQSICHSMIYAQAT